VRSVLARRGARLFFGGQLVSMFGDWALLLVFGIWAKSLTGSSADAGLVFFTFGAATLLAPLGGWVADRVPKRPLMLATHVAIGLVVLSLLVVHGRHQLWLIYVVTFLYGLAGDLFSGARSALMRVMFSDDVLVDANAALQTAREGLRLVAPLAGAGLYAAFGGGVAAVLDAATFGVSALTLALLRIDEPKPKASADRFMIQLAAGVRHIAHTEALRQLVLGVGAALLVIGFAETLIFTLIQHLHRPPSFFGVLSSLQGVGAIAGGVTAPRMLRRLGDTKLSGLGLLLFATGDTAFLVPNLALVLVAIAVAGVGVAWLVIAFATAVQTRTPLAIQARVATAANVGTSVPSTIGIALGAALSTVVDFAVLIVVMGVVTACCGAWLATRTANEPVPEPATA
jgi:MFS family permease